MKVMLLAAGQGKRMRPLTEHCPKPLVKLGGRPLIVWQIQRLAAAGFRDFVINCGYLGEQLPAALGTGADFGVNIVYSKEPSEGLETGGGIVQALPLLGDAPFVVTNADVWTQFPYQTLSLAEGRLAHLVLVPNPQHNQDGDFGLTAEGVVTNEQAMFTFSGIGVYCPTLFAGQKAGVFPLAPILREAIKLGRVTGELFDGDWQDIGTPQRLAELEAQL